MTRSFSGSIVLSFKFMYDLDLICTFVQFVARRVLHTVVWGIPSSTMSPGWCRGAASDRILYILHDIWWYDRSLWTLFICNTTSTPKFIDQVLYSQPGGACFPKFTGEICPRWFILYVIPRRRAETTAILSFLVRILLYNLQQKLIQLLYHQDV